MMIIFHPQIETSLAVIGTSLIIYSDSKSSLAYKFLTSKVLFLLINFIINLYLWHYSIFSVVRYISPDELNFLLIFFTYYKYFFYFYI